MIKKYKITVNGRSYDVTVEDGENTPAGQAVNKVGYTQVKQEQPAAAVQTAETAVLKGAVKAPMPGKVQKILVSEGDSVKAGQLVAILEAMKMENEIFASADGTVSKIVCKVGYNVSTGDDLLVIE